ncbi:hypothetical protein KAR91_27700 [Candidatus Pacearchaeota archaeon]|nr:hypothetical protein [Candidatus Pacearchaeota archaeon]
MEKNCWNCNHGGKNSGTECTPVDRKCGSPTFPLWEPIKLQPKSDKITIPEIERDEIPVRCGDSPIELCDFFDCASTFQADENDGCHKCAVYSVENFNKWKESLKE